MAKKDRQVFGGMEGLTFQNTAENPASANNSNSEYQYIPKGKIKPSPFNEGMPMDSWVIKSYADSMRKHGIMQPIAVYDLGDGTYEILSGHQRFEAWCKVLRHSSIPAVIHQMQPDLRQKFMAHTQANTERRENDGRFWTSRIAVARKVLYDTGFKGSKEQENDAICDLLGIAKSQLYRYLAFSKLDPSVQECEAKGYVSVRKLGVMNSLEPEKQKAVAKKITEYCSDREKVEGDSSAEITAKELDTIINDVKNGTTENPPAKKPLSYEARTEKAADTFLKMISKSKTSQEREIAIKEIQALRLKLDEAENSLKKAVDKK